MAKISLRECPVSSRLDEKQLAALCQGRAGRCKQFGWCWDKGSICAAPTVSQYSLSSLASVVVFVAGDGGCLEEAAGKRDRMLAGGASYDDAMVGMVSRVDPSFSGGRGGAG